MIKIYKIVLDDIIKHAKKDAPLEACGYLAGSDDTICSIFPMTNIDKSPEHFSFDPQEQFEVIRKIRPRGIKIQALYHSHPASPARLSDEDLRLAQDPDIIYIIHSLLTSETRAFKIAGKDVVEEKLEVI